MSAPSGITAPAGRLWLRVQRATPFGGNLLLTMGTNIALAALGFFSGPLVARLLGPHGRGELAAIQMICGTAAMVAMLGTNDAVVFFTAREPRRAGRVLASALLLCLAAAPLFALATYFVLPALLSAHSTGIVQAARLYLVIVFIFPFALLTQSSLRGAGNLVAWNFLRGLAPAGWLLLLCVLWFLQVRDPRLVAFGYVGIMLLLAPVGVALVLKRIAGPFSPDRSLWMPLTRYGAPLLLSTFTQAQNLRIDLLLVILLAEPAVVGLYAVSTAWSAAINPLVSAMGAVIFPRVAEQQSAQEGGKLLAQGMRIGAFIAALLAGLLLAITPLAVPLLFGRAFAAAVPSAMVLLMASALAAVTLLLEQGVRGLGDPKILIASQLTAWAITSALVWWLLPLLGLAGAALAALAGTSANLAVLLARVSRLTGAPAFSFLFLRREDLRIVRERIRAILAAS